MVVHTHRFSHPEKLATAVGHDIDFRYRQLRRRLRNVWQMATSDHDRDLLGRTVCERQFDW